MGEGEVKCRLIEWGYRSALFVGMVLKVAVVGLRGRERER